MKELIERAFEVRDSLIHCVASYSIYTCRQCAYFQNGCRCRNELMLDAVDAIGRLIEKVNDG